MISQRKTTAISLLALGLLLWASLALAASAATITHLSGPLVVRTASGVTKVLSIGSKVDEGDTVVTERRTYARLKFSDGGEVTLRPNTQFKVDKYAYDQAKPKDDEGSFSLIKGGLRAVSGQIGKRGNQDSYRMKTPTATIGIRGTIFIADYVEPAAEKAQETVEPVLVALAEAPVVSDAPPLLLAAAPPVGLLSGLTVQTVSGTVILSGAFGSQLIPQGTAFNLASPTAPPMQIPLPQAPAFKPPAHFPPPGTGTPPPPSSGGGAPEGGGGQGSGQPKTDCEMR